MASANKFDIFTLDLINGVHDFDGHVFKALLTNRQPLVTDAIRSTSSELATANGYTQGHADNTLAVVTNQTALAGTARVRPNGDLTITATGAVGPFRWVVIYNDTPTSPADPLLVWYEYTSAVSLAAGETFKIDFDNTDSGGLLSLV